jgi:hypothetical protein
LNVLLLVCLTLQVLAGLQHTLLSKLDESAQLLQQTPASQPEQLGQQLYLVQQLLQTLAATSSTKSSMPL